MNVKFLFHLAIFAALFLQACAGPSRLEPVPLALTTKVVAINTLQARYYPDEQVTEMLDEGIRALEREMRVLAVADPSELPVANFLAISGGSDQGAFGAGLLVGWTETGMRPEFKLVTGVSTGALAAPFAFLGPAYDDQLRQVFTGISAKDIYTKRSIFAIFFNDAVLDTAPLFDLISRFINNEMLVAIAREYEKGRLLFIGTTNLDAKRPVIWNIGAIAASGQPGALELVRKILLASAAIPGAFPPVMVDIEVDGKKYQEMHVDGSAIAQLFLYPPVLAQRIKESNFKRERRAFLIRNGRLSYSKDWSIVEPRTMHIMGEAISTMIYMSGMNDLFRLYVTTQLDDVDYNLAIIEDDFDAPPGAGDFDPAFMKALFEYGYKKGRNGYPWKKTPPSLQAR